MPRRSSTVQKPPEIANDFSPPAPKTLELENRIAELEVLYKGLRAAYENQHRAIVALKAELDHLRALLTMR